MHKLARYRSDYTPHNTDEHVTGVVDEYGNEIKSKHHDPSRQPGRRFMIAVSIFFKHLGLLLLLMAYLAGGGFLFRALELSNESSECFQRQATYVRQINASTQRFQALFKAQLEASKQQEDIGLALESLAKELYVINYPPDANCSAILNTKLGAQWNIGNSIFFCATVITSIGYGNIVPVTYWGRITCIIYAVIGIPLMLLYLAIVGKNLARLFRFVYVNLVCCRCFYDHVYRRRRERKQRLLKWEQDLREHEEEEARRRGLPVPPARVPMDSDDVDDEDEQELEREYAAGIQVAVPLSISILVMTGYAMIGAALFSSWEDWTMAESVYFTFITLLTIGFGDLVPGMIDSDKANRIVQLAMGTVYLIIGMSLISMCLNLMQDEISAKVNYLTECIGGAVTSSLLSSSDRDKKDEAEEKPEDGDQEEQEKKWTDKQNGSMDYQAVDNNAFEKDEEEGLDSKTG